MQTVLVNITDLKPASYNPRKMPASEMKKLESSIKKFGFVEPVVVNTTTGNIVGGHQRTIAASNLGITEVPVVYVTIPEGEEKSLNIALNRIHGEWDEEKLSQLLKQLNTEEKGLTGFDEEELLRLVKLLDEPENLVGELKKKDSEVVMKFKSPIELEEKIEKITSFCVENGIEYIVRGN